MTLPDRHDHELAAHHRREEAAQARRDELTKTAIDNLTERYWQTFESGGDGFEFFCDEITTIPQTTRIRLAAAHRTNDQAEAGRILAEVHEAALGQYIDYFESREIDRLCN